MLPSCLLAIPLVLIPRASWAAPGDVDATFGADGRVITAFGMPASANALVVQPDGKLVAAGSTGQLGHSAFALARYNGDGTLDATFGAGGKVTTVVGAASGASAIVVQPDGKLVAAGQSGGSSTSTFALVRYRADGSLDTSFGSGGQVTTAGTVFTSEPAASASALVLQPDGKLVAAGATVGHRGGFAIARYNVDGTLDPGFGAGGTVASGAGVAAWAAALVLQADGKLVAAGTSLEIKTGGVAGGSFVVERYSADGRFDQTFGTNGRVTTAIGTNAVASALAIQPDGKLIVAGSTSEYAGNGLFAAPAFVLARYNTDGSLDPAFGTGGTVTTRFGQGAAAMSLAVQRDGQLVAAGYATSGSGYELALARYCADGSLDTTFAPRGTVASAVDVVANAVVVQSDEKLVAAGGSGSAEGAFALVRYENAGSACPNDSVGGSACPEDSVPAKITKKFARARDLIARAAVTPAKEHKLQRRAKVTLRAIARAVRRATKGRHPKLSGACAAEIKRATEGLSRLL